MPWERHQVLERCAVGAVAAWGVYLLARYVSNRRVAGELEAQLREAQAALEHERLKRQADRVGRIRAEQELRAVKVRLQQAELQAALQRQGQDAGAAGAAGEQPSEEQAEEGPAGAAAGREGAQNGSCGPRGPKGSGRRAAAEATRVEANDGGAGAGADDDDDGDGRGSGGGGGGGGRGLSAVYETKRAAAAAAAALAAAGSAMPAFPFRPIGHLRSVFSERNGTPRQPQLVPAARSRLVLAPNVPPACLEGLGQYSHVWVLYVFHANTDLAKYLSPDRTGLKAKIHVPRLNGGRMGVLATRSPHRPSPIGLSTAEVIAVEGGSLLLGGADIVDGSPVLDIKPYVPFCDCLPAARAPAWVQAEADDEPLAVAEVVVGPAAAAALAAAWRLRRPRSLYGSEQEFLTLVRQVLARDIRSVHQRLNVRPTQPPAAAAASSSAAAPAAAASSSRTAAAAAAAAPPPTPGLGAPAAAAAPSEPPCASHPPDTWSAPSTPPLSRAATAEGLAAAPQPQPPAPAPAPPGAAAANCRQQQQQQRRAGGVGQVQGGGGGGSEPCPYHVVLDGVYIAYDISPAGVVEVGDAWLDPVTGGG